MGSGRIYTDFAFCHAGVGALVAAVTCFAAKWACKLAGMPVSPLLLRQFPLLGPLPQQAKESVSQAMVLREFARRSSVLSKGDLQPDLGFLVEGRLQGVDFTVDGRSVGLYFVDPGDYFGELSVVDGQPASEFVVAATRSTVAFLEARLARELIFTQPDVAREVLSRLAGRVRSVTAQRTLLGLPNPFQRLCTLILQLPQRRVDGEVHIDNAPTHQELAIMINASRETVTRAFHLLFFHALLLREGNTLKLVRLDALRDIAEGRAEPPKA